MDIIKGSICRAEGGRSRNKTTGLANKKKTLRNYEVEIIHDNTDYDDAKFNKGATFTNAEFNEMLREMVIDTGSIIYNRKKERYYEIIPGENSYLITEINYI